MGNDMNSTTRPLYTLGVTSQLTGVPAHSIRQYIDKNLVIPFRTKAGRHLFSDADLNRIRSIKKNIHVLGLNTAGIKAVYSLIPCWSIMDCKEANRKNCPAFQSFSLPCWEASGKTERSKNTDCRTCKVYQVPASGDSIKECIRKFI
jgi:MerR family transcriptional regulator/heat shock protein HspR